MNPRFDAEPGAEPPVRHICHPSEVDLEDRIKRITASPAVGPIADGRRLPLEFPERVKEREAILRRFWHGEMPPDSEVGMNLLDGASPDESDSDQA